MQMERQFLVAAFQRAEARLHETTLPPRALIAEALDSSDTRFAAVDGVGAWTLVLVARKSGKRLPGLKLNSLSADYGVSYRLHTGDAVEQLRVSVLSCGAADRSVRTLFAAFCATVLGDLPDDPTDADLERQVAKWIALFWRLQVPARRTVIGLIGELTILDKVKHLAPWVRAWHSVATDNLDFAFPAPPLSVEVKATSSQQRIHELSLHQVLPVEKESHFVASVIVELRASGERLGDVVDEMLERLTGTPEARQFLDVLADVCGSSLHEFFEVRYMRNVSQASLEFFRAGEVPRPNVELPLPAGVSHVRFTSDFSSIGSIDPAPILAFGG